MNRRDFLKATSVLALPSFPILARAAPQGSSLSGVNRAGGMNASEYAVPMGIMNAGKGHLNRTGQGWLASQMLSLLNKKVSVNG